LAPNVAETPFELYQTHMQRGQVENYIKKLQIALKGNDLQERQRNPTVCRGHWRISFGSRRGERELADAQRESQVSGAAARRLSGTELGRV